MRAAPNDDMAIVLEQSTRHSLKAFAELKQEKFETWEFQNTLEDVFNRIDSIVASKLLEMMQNWKSRQKIANVEDEDGNDDDVQSPKENPENNYLVTIETDDGKSTKKMDPLFYIESRFQFLCGVTRAVDMKLDQRLKHEFNIAFDKYTYAQNATVPRYYPHRIMSMLKQLTKIKHIYNRLKQNTEESRRARSEMLETLLVKLTARGFDILESGLGSLIYSPENMRAFTEKYLKSYKKDFQENDTRGRLAF